MFNVCNATSGQNYIYLYDEHTSGKDGNAVCSMRWRFRTRILREYLQNNKKPPKLALKVMDNCVGQNKSQTTLMFDCMLCLLRYDQVANLYLLPGQYHADQTTALCKESLAKKDLYVSDKIKDSMNTVANMHADVLVEEDFYKWE